MIRQDHKLWLYWLLTFWWPDSNRLMRLKAALLRCCGVRVGKNVNIYSNVRFCGDGKICIGDRCTIKSGCFIHSSSGGDIKLESDVFIARGVHIEAEGHIFLSQGSQIMQYTILTANGNSSLKVGRNCQIAHFVSLKTSHHQIDPFGKCIGGECLFSDITIGDGVWMCACSMAIPGVTIGNHCLIAGGAVVISDCEPYSLYAGCPATLKKHYRPDAICARVVTKGEEVGNGTSL